MTVAGGEGNRGRGGRRQRQQEGELEKTTLSKQIEAILYLKAKPTTVREIASLTGYSPEEVEEALIQLLTDYAYRETALEIVEKGGGYCLQLQPVYQSLLENLMPAELSKATLKTLAAIALKGPILQSELISLRGSIAYQHVKELVELGFVRKSRQREGKSYWLEVTDKFHRYFEINSLPQ
ncbi:MAG TPA: SMC-Scp complex subunit ScpB [Geminocystis sp. M7585_C2015_104]|nr:SMC-Scp complex subunit ScpB [Geminocystis sp. M7585_C2015_104]